MKAGKEHNEFRGKRASIEDCRAALQDAGLKATHQRLIIFRTLLNFDGHPDAESIHAALKEENPTLSLGTIYRTLEAFVQAGLLSRFTGEEGRMRFDTNLEPHHHLICNTSARILDYDDQELNQLIKDYFRRKPIDGFDVESFQLHIHGNSRQDYD